MLERKGRATRGSQFWLQMLVNERPELLDKSILQDAPSLRGQKIEWVSPLAAEGYREYQDRAFLAQLGIEPTNRSLDSFWPEGGPVWDGLARTSKGEVLLIEAKSHIPEAVSPPSRASSKSLARIRSSLDEAKRYFKGRTDADWSGLFYQYANRLAHLYFLRVLNNVSAHLAFIYFVGDEEMGGPDTIEEWQGAVKIIETFLGVGRTPLTNSLHHIFIDVRAV